MKLHQHYNLNRDPRERGSVVTFDLAFGAPHRSSLEHEGRVPVGAVRARDRPVDFIPVAAVRERLYETGLYGVRFTAIQVPSLARTPLNDCTANLIVSERLLSGPSNQNAATDILRTSGRRAGTEVFSVPGAKRVVASGCAGAVRQTPSISSVTKHWNIR